MSNEWLLFIFLLLAIVAAGDIMRRAVVALLYDQNEQKIAMAMRKVRGNSRPHVTVLVYGKNQTKALEDTVRLVRRNRYGKYDIVAIRDRSLDSPATSLKQYIEKPNNRVRIRLLQRRVNGSKIDAYRAAYRKSQRGAVIICLQAGDRVNNSFIKRAVAARRGREQWYIRHSRSNNPSMGLFGITRSFVDAVWPRLTRSIVFVPAALRRSKASNRYGTVNYNESVMVALLLIVGCALAMFIGGVKGLWYAWMLFSGYLLAVLWLYGGVGALEKWKRSFAVPSALFLLPVASLFEVYIQPSKSK